MRVNAVRTATNKPGERLAHGVPLPDAPRTLAEAFTLCTDVQQSADGTPTGDPTETAMVRWAAEQGVDAPTLRGKWPRVGEVAFSSERARMTTVHRIMAGAYRVACTKGHQNVSFRRALACGTSARWSRSMPQTRWPTPRPWWRVVCAYWPLQ
jgi:Ca2+-transporting ATPase